MRKFWSLIIMLMLFLCPGIQVQASITGVSGISSSAELSKSCSDIRNYGYVDFATYDLGTYNLSRGAIWPNDESYYKFEFSSKLDIEYSFKMHYFHAYVVMTVGDQSYILNDYYAPNTSTALVHDIPSESLVIYGKGSDFANVSFKLYCNGVAQSSTTIDLDAIHSLSSIYYSKVGEVESSLIQDAYDQGFSDGLEEGEDNGYNLGYQDGFVLGHDAGYDAGYNTGYSQGFEEGVISGSGGSGSSSPDDTLYDENDLQEYYDKGYSAGQTVGYESGYSQGYDSGVITGYEQGYAAALDELYSSGAAGTGSGSHTLIGSSTVDLTVAYNAYVPANVTTVVPFTKKFLLDLGTELDSNKNYCIKYKIELKDSVDIDKSDSTDGNGYLQQFRSRLNTSGMYFTIGGTRYEIKGHGASDDIYIFEPTESDDIGITFSGEFVAMFTSTSLNTYANMSSSDVYSVTLSLYEYDGYSNEEVIVNAVRAIAAAIATDEPDNSGSLNDSNNSLTDSVTDFEQNETDLYNDAAGHITNVQDSFFDAGSDASFLTAASLYSSMISSLWLALGPLQSVVIISLTFVIIFMILRKYRG